MLQKASPKLQTQVKHLTCFLQQLPQIGYALRLQKAIFAAAQIAVTLTDNADCTRHFFHNMYVAHMIKNKTNRI